MQLIKDNVNSVLNSLVGDMFSMNRLLDRQMSVLSIKMVMPKTVSLLHPKLAHLFPSYADFISDYQGSRNALTIYPETPIADQDYVSPLDIFNKMLEFQINIEENVSEAIVFAYNEGDMNTKVFLQDFLLKLNRVTEQILLLVDKSTMYGDNPINWMLFDSNVEDFVIL